MEDGEKKPLPTAARIARFAAIAALPICILLGLAFSSGQDAAGAGMAVSGGFFLGIAASVFFWIWYWIFKSPRRTRIALPIALIPTALVGGWFALDTFGPQEYALIVRNASGEDLTEIDVQIAGAAIFIGQIDDDNYATREGMTAPPESALTVSWVNSAQERQQFLVESREPPRYRYNRITLVIYIYPENKAMAFFSSDRSLF